MNLSDASEKLDLVGQKQLLKFWDALSPVQQESLLKEINQIDLEIYTQQKKTIFASQPKKRFSPFTEIEEAGNADDTGRGQQLITEGKVGCLIVAGGQGSRLNLEGPKGAFPISLVEHKSLFQLFAEKTVAASNQAGRLLPLAIMTSPLNDTETRDFFMSYDFFGLKKKQLFFFSQNMLPILDTDGNFLLEEKGEIAKGPDGNGYALHHFVSSGIWKSWYEMGVRYLNFVPIDNPLADPFDAELFGFHHRQNAEVIIKCIKREVEEKVGTLVQTDQGVEVIEYSEFPPEESHATLPDGEFKHRYANISLFCFAMEFVNKVADVSLPLHPAFKSVKTVEGKQMAWKSETFIFDVLSYADNVKALLYPRSHCFAPLKDLDDVAKVQKALQKRDREMFIQATGNPPPTTPFDPVL